MHTAHRRTFVIVPFALFALAAASGCSTTVIGGPIEQSRGPVEVDEAQSPAEATDTRPRAPGEAQPPATADAHADCSERQPNAPKDPKGVWEPSCFKILDGVQSECAGERYVKHVPEYDVWVGAILCSPTRYKLLMSDKRDGVYLELTDTAGHGQDHCEIINPAFTIPDEDDITSGCPSCVVEQNFVANGPQAYARAIFGEPFKVVSDMPQWAYQTNLAIECGVSIP